MRLRLFLTPACEPVPFTYPYRLAGVLHRWLGQNDWHDGLSLYSFGWLQGGRLGKDGLYFPKGAFWTLSFYEGEQVQRVVAGIFREPAVIAGMAVAEVQAVPIPVFGERVVFRVESPVVARRVRADGGRDYLTWADEGADEVLTRVFRRKLTAAGLGHLAPQASMRFDRRYRGAKTKLVRIKGIDHRGSMCPVIVEGPPEAVQFAWLVGAGELTGCGFGALGEPIGPSVRVRRRPRPKRKARN
ncbi:CRISPR-associated endoribonuclease Cas6 [Rhodothermus profundi]|uniref:CRISPR-associated protein, Cas6 family n=1 Tax=Rhodothermus profundi TaxID=633813 RepID=A0A1M6V572_9BACT|nr:CRISPR-associated endoribonuclease Cas6 [Rhodothermus profundi]SHK76608.1 CRISPR-associated protein, Cas6 family [Rhodothermus profundi]